MPFSNVNPGKWPFLARYQDIGFDDWPADKNKKISYILKYFKYLTLSKKKQQIFQRGSLQSAGLMDSQQFFLRNCSKLYVYNGNNNKIVLLTDLIY